MRYVLIIRFDTPGADAMTRAQFEALMRECVDPLARENLDVFDAQITGLVTDNG